MRKMRIPQIFTLIPGFYVDPKSQLTTILPQKNKKHRQSSDYQCLQPVGVTGFEPATTRPPAVERIFVFISIGLEISDTIPCEWGDVLYLLRLSEMKSVIKM